MQAKFEDFLDDISRCFVQGDISVWQARLILPFSIITKSGPVLLSTEREVTTNFNYYLEAMGVMKVDLVFRTPISLEDCQDGTWLGTFQTKLLSSGILATAAYTSTALLHLQNDRFRMSSMLNGRGHSEWTGVGSA